MTRTRSDAILDELGRLTRRLARLVGTEDTLALTATQRIALFELGVAGPLRVNDLARRIGVSTPTASRTADALEEHGLVTRTRDPDDRRALRVDLSREGRRLFADRKQRASEAFRPASAVLSADERETLLALLARLGDALEE